MIRGRALRAVADDEIAERLALGWWWVTEPNPPCAPWCDRVHAFDEFAADGCLVCWRAVAIAPDFEVSVNQAQMATEGPGREISRAVDVVVKAEEIELDRIGALSSALRRAQFLGCGAVA